MIFPRGLQARLSFRYRRQRVALLRAMIERIYVTNGRVRIIDMGGEIGYWEGSLGRVFLHACRVHVTLVNISAENLFTNPNPDPVVFTNVIGNCCDLNFANDAFDLAHSNSVIEHVGSWAAMRDFAYETRRVAPNYWVQTPNFWFPIEPHFGVVGFHWMPEAWRIARVRRGAVGKGPWTADFADATEIINYYHLLDRHQFSYLFPDAAIVPEKSFGLTKSFVAIRQSEPD